MIKQARMKKGLTQKQLATKVGLSNSYICRMENNENRCFEVKLNHIYKIADVLDICPLELVTHLSNICATCPDEKKKWTNCPYRT